MITDELRHEVANYPFRDNRDFALFEAIADRIDAEYQKAIRELNNLVDASIFMPVDANGEIIHIGDDMERGKARGHVIALMLSNYPKKWGGGLHWSIQLEGEQAPTALDLMFHHYHEPTVEDVLREFANLFAPEATTLSDQDFDETIAEYAQKLQLREA